MANTFIQRSGDNALANFETTRCREQDPAPVRGGEAHSTVSSGTIHQASLDHEQCNQVRPGVGPTKTQTSAGTNPPANNIEDPYHKATTTSAVSTDQSSRGRPRMPLGQAQRSTSPPRKRRWSTSLFTTTSDSMCKNRTPHLPTVRQRSTSFATEVRATDQSSKMQDQDNPSALQKRPLSGEDSCNQPPQVSPSA